MLFCSKMFIEEFFEFIGHILYLEAEQSRGKIVFYIYMIEDYLEFGS